MDFVYFSVLNWDHTGGAHTGAQMARAVARRGHSVLFIEPQPSAVRNTDGLAIEIVALTELGLSPMELRRVWHGLPGDDLTQVAENLLARVKGKGERVAVYTAPFEPFVRLLAIMRANDFSIVYYALTDFGAAAALGNTQYSVAAEKYLATHADRVFATTPHTASILASILASIPASILEPFGKQVVVLPNGVDREAVKPNVPRTPNVLRGEFTLGFWGALTESAFDAELVAFLAQARSRWMIHLLGATNSPAPAIVERLKNFPNVFIHNKIGYAELSSYLAVFDVCLAPFPDNPVTQGQDPVNVYAYLAAHVPVVSSNLAQLQGIPYVLLAHSPQEFLDAIQTAVRTRMDTSRLDEFLDRQTWGMRAETFLQNVSGLLGTKHVPGTTDVPITRRVPNNAPPEPASGVLPGFVQPNVKTVLDYARMLERELQELHEQVRSQETGTAGQNNEVDRVKHLITALGKRSK